MKPSFGSEILNLAVRLLAPFVLLFAVYVILHGHYSPGGGFQGGTLIAVTFIMLRMVSSGEKPSWGISSKTALYLAAFGLTLYAGIGTWVLFYGRKFLDYAGLPFHGDEAHVRALGTLGIEIGVALTVTGILFLIYESLVGEEGSP